MRVKAITITGSMLAGLLAMGISAPLQAGADAESPNLFEGAGEKQVGADFKPAPDKEAHSGSGC